MAACETVRAIGPNGPVVINKSDYDADQADGGAKIYTLDGDESTGQPVATGQAVASTRRSMSSGEHAQVQMDASLRQNGVTTDEDDDDEAETLEVVIDGRNLPNRVAVPAALPGTADAADALTDVDPPADGTGVVARRAPDGTAPKRRGGRPRKNA